MVGNIPQLSFSFNLLKVYENLHPEDMWLYLTAATKTKSPPFFGFRFYISNILDSLCITKVYIYTYVLEILAQQLFLGYKSWINWEFPKYFQNQPRYVDIFFLLFDYEPDVDDNSAYFCL